MNKRVNVVLQGGGVRGIAYVGALESLPPDVALHTVGGTSAGSIVAALLAIGKTPADINAIMMGLDLGALLDPAEQVRLARLKNVGAAVQGRNGFLHKLRRGLYVVWSLRTLASDLRYLAGQRGLHDSRAFKGWLDQVFGDKKFCDIEVEELYVVASDVSKRRLVTYCKAEYPQKLISEAVLASASIPLFFRPVAEADRVLVDGGMLSNFPSYLFARSEYPTVGLRLKGDETPRDLRSFPVFARSLLDTMTDAHDAERTPQFHFRQFTIDTGDISSVDFNLTPRQKTQLLESGRSTGRRIPWELLAKSQPVLRFDDPRPDDVLSWSLTQMRAAGEAAEQKANWCRELDEELFLDYFIEEDWSTRMVFHYRYRVRGPQPLAMRRFGLPKPPNGISLFDILPEISSSPLPPAFSVHMVPWAADAERKGFTLLMVPPITEHDGQRGFTISVRIKDDHKKNLAINRRDEFPVLARRRAHTHNFRGVARFWVAKTLGVGIQAHAPNAWDALVDESPSPWSERYVCAGLFETTMSLSGDVVSKFPLERVELPVADGGDD